MDMPAIIDIEASGFGRGSYPIEVGFIEPSGEVGCSLIKPVDSWLSWCSEAEKLHGISREILMSHGREIEWIANWLNERFCGQTIYSDGWANDMSWLGKLYEEANVPQLFKLESLLVLMSEEEKERWSLVYDEVLSVANLTRHRASTDARLIQETFRRIKGV